MSTKLKILLISLVVCLSNIFGADFQFAEKELEEEPVEIDDSLPEKNDVSENTSFAEAVGIQGKIAHFQSLGLYSPNDFNGLRTSLDFNAEHRTSRTILFGNIKATYNHILPERTGFELKEAYVNYNSENWDIQLGRQKFSWGQGDAVTITDPMSPRDYTEFLTFDPEDRILPVEALRLRLFLNSFTLETVMIPVFTPSRLPNPGTPWAPETESYPVNMSGAEGDVKYKDISKTPALKASSVQAGGRMQFFIRGFDLAFSGFYLYDNLPVIKKDYSLDPNSFKNSEILEYRRYSFAGSDFSFSTGPLVFRGEYAFYFNKHLMRNVSFQDMLLPLTNRPEPTSEHHIFKGLAGVDWDIGRGWNLSVQGISEIIMNYDEQLVDDEYSFTATSLISKSLFRERLLFSAQAYYAHQQCALFSRVKIVWSAYDGLNLILGGDVFHAFPHGEVSSSGYDISNILRQYKKNDSIWIKAVYKF